jgi:hypothetical protein
MFGQLLPNKNKVTTVQTVKNTNFGYPKFGNKQGA